MDRGLEAPRRRRPRGTRRVRRRGQVDAVSQAPSAVRRPLKVRLRYEAGRERRLVMAHAYERVAPVGRRHLADGQVRVSGRRTQRAGREGVA